MQAFNFKMSYAELKKALFFASQRESMLSKGELRCLESSLQDPFLQKMLVLYPLPKKSQKIVAASIEHQRAIQRLNHGNDVYVDTNVHSAIYGGQRDLTASYLEQNYPASGDVNVIDKLELFIGRLLESEEACSELRIAERERYSIRQRNYYSGRLTTLSSLQSLEHISADFREYLRYLRLLKQQNSTYAWGALASLFRRLESLDEAEKLPAELMLLRGLDDSRTAYHDQPRTFFIGKAYTCLQGLEERLLDHHAVITPSQGAEGADRLEQTILALTEPFILRDQEAERPFCSQALYQLYLNAAGYSLEERRERYFKLRPGFDKTALKQQFLSTAREGLPRRRAESVFQSFMGSMDDIPADELERDYFGLVSFLRAQEGLLTGVEKLQTYLTPPDVGLSSDVVMARMVEQGPFIDRAHLEMVLALHEAKASLDAMEQAALSGTPGAGTELTQSVEDMRGAYQRYVVEMREPFRHFMDVRLLLPVLSAEKCSQTVLCDLISANEYMISQSVAERLAAFCARQGYNTALMKLCQLGLMTPDHIVSSQHRSMGLLSVASESGHIGVVKDLIDAGSNVNTQTSWGGNSLILAASHGDTDVVSALIQAGVNVNIKDGQNHTALSEAFSNDYFDTTILLLEAGADVRLWPEVGFSAWIVSLRHDHTAIWSMLIEAGVSIDYNLLICAPLRFFSILILKIITFFNNVFRKLGVAQLCPTPRQHFIAALESGDRQAAQLHISNGLNVNCLIDGRSALEVVVQRGGVELLKEILKAEKIAPWTVIKAIKQCVEYREHHHTMLPLLLSHSNMPELIIRNGHQQAPLAWAAEHQCAVAVQAFMEAGASLVEQNSHGETALMIAQRLGNQDILTLLNPNQAVPVVGNPTDTVPPLLLSTPGAAPLRMPRLESVRVGGV